MRVTIADRSYKYTFSHLDYKGTLEMFSRASGLTIQACDRIAHRLRKDCRVTVCYLLDVTGHENDSPDATSPVMGVGISMCLPEDTYDRDRGRKIALADALKRSLPHDLRGPFWANYLGRFDRERERRENAAKRRSAYDAVKDDVVREMNRMDAELTQVAYAASRVEEPPF